MGFVIVYGKSVRAIQANVYECAKKSFDAGYAQVLIKGGA